jgi:hypothetical protein
MPCPIPLHQTTSHIEFHFVRVILLATPMKLEIGQEIGIRDKPSQELNKISRYWLYTGLPEKGKGR